MAEPRTSVVGVLFGLLDPVEVAARAAEFGACVARLRCGEDGGLAVLLPGDGWGLAQLLDVAAVAEVVGVDPRQVGPAGEPLGANVARLRAALRRWALRPQPGADVGGVEVAPSPEPAGFRELLTAVSREHYGARAGELGAAALTDDQLIMLTEDPSWVVGAPGGTWAGVLAEHVQRQSV